MVHALRLCLFIINLLSVGLYGLAAQAKPVSASSYLTMVICTELGTQTITLDADGTPVEPSPECPTCLDCFSFPPFVPAGTVDALSAPANGLRAWFPPSHPEHITLALTTPLPRGPPPGTVADLDLHARAAHQQAPRIGIAEHIWYHVQRIDGGNKRRAKNEVAR